MVLGVAAALAAPATWTVSTAAREYTGISTSPEAGPLFADWEFVDAPPEVRAQLSAAAAEFLKPENLGQVLGPTVPAAADLAALRFAAERSDGRRYALAVSDAVRAADLIADSGASVLPMGGFTGRVPFPDREHFLSLLRAGSCATCWPSRRPSRARRRRPPRTWSGWRRTARRSIRPSTAWARPRPTRRPGPGSGAEPALRLCGPGAGGPVTDRRTDGGGPPPTAAGDRPGATRPAGPAVRRRSRPRAAGS
ncbi:hypothetical protein ACFQ0M_11805 [Kitasatospora aburaviensis]